MDTHSYSIMRLENLFDTVGVTQIVVLEDKINELHITSRLLFTLLLLFALVSCKKKSHARAKKMTTFSVVQLITNILQNYYILKKSKAHHGMCQNGWGKGRRGGKVPSGHRCTHACCVVGTEKGRQRKGIEDRIQHLAITL